jgi:hypothetical protein
MLPSSNLNVHNKLLGIHKNGDGVFGLGLTQQGQVSLIDKLYEAGKIEQPIVALFLAGKPTETSNESLPASSISFGSYDL